MILTGAVIGVLLSAGTSINQLFIMSPAPTWDWSECATCYGSMAYWDPVWSLQQNPLAPWYTVSMAQVLSSLAYVLFGGIHCLAWRFTQPHSRLVWLMWVVSAITVTTAPVLHLFVRWLVVQPQLHRSLRPGFWLLVLIYYLEAFVFLLARMFLVIIPFIELTRLPNSAFKSVSWDDFLPHIG
jgi:hypothetical protein